ncbi:hypothetical protein BaRGS_00009012 [Batillaria attramentaria]|uniref:Uncharacterized protein n=1 Tax=Batillaria attramentaria TaxID=370345 RepID=A0ABD0LK56_9CAEN
MWAQVRLDMGKMQDLCECTLHVEKDMGTMRARCGQNVGKMWAELNAGRTHRIIERCGHNMDRTWTEHGLNVGRIWAEQMEYGNDVDRTWAEYEQYVGRQIADRPHKLQERCGHSIGWTRAEYEQDEGRIWAEQIERERCGQDMGKIRDGCGCYEETT